MGTYSTTDRATAWSATPSPRCPSPRASATTDVARRPSPWGPSSRPSGTAAAAAALPHYRGHVLDDDQGPRVAHDAAAALAAADGVGDDGRGEAAEPVRAVL